ncbi:uncharacterized protein JCM6883_001314 [Sporobolomyces salmoneus]|uniref:uncharacterized protein n=1 Tax=Sporobolomyces salmoneus TaxID=183962 RepID=UPI00317FA6E8
MSSAVSTLSATHQSLFFSKKEKKLTFEQIGNEIGRDEVWVAAVFYGQAKPLKKDLEGLSKVLGIPLNTLEETLGEDHYWPERGAVTPMPPTDPVLYRLYEALLVYGYPIKQVIHEKFGDGIMSAISFNAHVEKVEKDGAEYVKLSFLGKFLPYTRW